MKRCYRFLLLFCVPFSLNAQYNGSVIRIDPKIFDAMVSDIDTLTGIKGKYIISEMDTLYLMNPFGVQEFVACSLNLEKCRQLYMVTEDLASDISSIQENLQALDKNSASFREYALIFQQENALRLQELENINKVLENNLQTITLQLNETREKLKNERWNSMGKKLLWGTGGFVTGTVFTAILVALVK